MGGATLGQVVLGYIRASKHTEGDPAGGSSSAFLLVSVASGPASRLLPQLLAPPYPSSQEVEQADLCECEARLVYIESTRIAKAA